jgi:hypothetical protein
VSVSFSKLVHSLIDAILIFLKSFLFEVVGEFSFEELLLGHEHSLALHFVVD